MKISPYLILCVLYVNTFAVFGQTQSINSSPPLAEATPESAGMSSERLARIDAMAGKLVDEGNLPGMVALVARDGKIVYLKSFGAANAEGEPLRTDHIFRIASQTK
ncbi:MAG: serine hydrolase, partial [Gammaproteobacteria bacterium]|nr:serine hydrolase [Gammaproteobacteria bacterium]